MFCFVGKILICSTSVCLAVTEAPAWYGIELDWFVETKVYLILVSIFQLVFEAYCHLL